MLQYIGARYVPIFYQNSLDPTSTEWEPNVTYEPMTWVSLPNGYMYISKKEVPANIGTPAQNGDYWLEAGQYNAYIQHLQDQIDDMQDGTVPGSLQNEIDDINSDITTINNNIADMKDGTISGSLQYQINQREKEIANRYYLFIGDSYDQIISNASWVAIAATTAGIQNYIKRTSGGYGFVSNGTYTWYSLLLNNPFTDTEKNNITDVVIGGGTNDTLANQSDVANAIIQMDSYLRSLFPNLKRIHLSYMGWSHLNGTQKGQHRTCYETYLTTAHRLGWKWLHGVEYILHNPQLINRDVVDRVHPNYNGVHQLGYAVAQAILTGSTTNRMPMTQAMKPITANISSNNISLFTCIDNEMTECRLPDCTMTAATNLSAYFDIYESDDGTEINFLQDRYFPVYVVSGNTFIPALLYSSNTKTLSLWLKAGGSIASGATFQIVAQSMLFPTI